MSQLLNRDMILQADDLRKELLEVPEWGGSVYVRGMTGTERDKLESSMLEQRGKSQKMNLANVRARMAAMTLCDETGKLLFTEADVRALGTKSAAALQRVFEAAQRLSGLTQQDIDDITQEMEENPFDDSVTD